MAALAETKKPTYEEFRDYVERSIDKNGPLEPPKNESIGARYRYLENIEPKFDFSQVDDHFELRSIPVLNRKVNKKIVVQIPKRSFSPFRKKNLYPLTGKYEPFKSWGKELTDEEEAKAQLRNDALHYYHLLLANPEGKTNPREALEETMDRFKTVESGNKRYRGIRLSRKEIVRTVKQEISEQIMTDHVLKGPSFKLRDSALSYGFKSGKALKKYIGKSNTGRLESTIKVQRETRKSNLGEKVIEEFERQYNESNGKLHVTDFCRRQTMERGEMISTTFFYESARKNRGGIKNIREAYKTEQQQRQKTIKINRRVDIARKAAMIGLSVGALFIGAPHGKENYQTLRPQSEHIIQSPVEEQLAQANF